jgi:hypothetical protein
MATHAERLIITEGRTAEACCGGLGYREILKHLLVRL